MKFHPISNMLPMMHPMEYEALKEDIQKNGLQVPITRYEGMILDGRHRFKACEELKVEPQYQDFHQNGIQAVDYVIIHNLHRRHLNQSQKAVISLEYKDQLVKKSKENTIKPVKGMGKGRDDNKDAYKLTAKMFGVGHGVIRMANFIRNEKPKLLKEIKDGTLTVSKAYYMDRDNPFRPISTYHSRDDNALGLIHKKLNSGWTVELKMKKDSFQCHLSGDGVSDIRFKGEWSSKPCFEKFYEAIFSECK